MELSKDEEKMRTRYKRLKYCVIPILVMTCLFLLVFAITTTVGYTHLRSKASRPLWLGPGPSISPLERYNFMATASDSDFCGVVGSYIMVAKGGSAVDGAIATQLCDSLTNMQSVGISGGSFMLVYEKKTSKVVAIDFRDVAPGNATKNMYKKNPGLSLKGGLATSVPGELAGYYEAWKRFGRAPWATLFEPVIDMCENGYRVGTELDSKIKRYKDDIMKSPGLRALLVNNATGAILTTGDTIRNPVLAQTFRTIAADPFAFYNGSLAADVAREVQEAGGILTTDDLLNYRVTNPEVIRAVLPNSKFVVYGLRPPSSGTIVTFMLRVLDGFKITPDVKKSVKDYGLYLHRLAETCKFAYAKRSALGDENFIRAELSEVMKNLTSQAYADYVRSKITDDRTHSVSYYGPSFDWRPDHGTSHLSVVAPNGDAVSLTSSINSHFGSKVRGLKTGIIYNNGMDDFSTPNTTNFYNIPSSPSNYIEPGKRPQSSMSPTIVTYPNGSIALIVGASGGSQIISRIVYIATRVLFLKENIKEAIDAFRIHHQLVPNVLKVDTDFPPQLADVLRSKGHKIVAGLGSISQGIHIKDGFIYANSDHRKGGKPSGQ